MTAEATMPFTHEAARAAELRRVKFMATSVLVGAVVLLVIGRALTPKYPLFGFVAAFAEAAVIGGLADWYAVTALFRRPLGLPIPHTAIIENNRDHIGDSLGHFIEAYFLAPGPVEAKLREVDFAAFAAEWLQDRKRSGDLATYLLRMLPDALAAAETSGLTTFLARRILSQIQSVDLAPFAGGILRDAVRTGHHQALFDDFVGAVGNALREPATLAALREKIRRELPTLLNLYRADTFLMKRIAKSVGIFLEEVRGDPQHPLRGEFDRMIMAFAARLETDDVYARQLEALKREVLASARVGDLAGRLWSGAKAFAARSSEGKSGTLQRHLTSVLMEVGRSLATDADVRADINQGCVLMLQTFIDTQKRGVSGFIADQVKSWDMSRLVGLIELNIGKDLQYIRFNGTVIGGMAGLALYAIEVLIRAL